MSTSTEPLEQPLRRLPESAVPEGCPAWTGESARSWTRALPPRWLPARARSVNVGGVALVGLLGGMWLAVFAGVPAALAALLPLHLVWALVRPEAVRVSAPLLTLVLAWHAGGLGPVLVPALLLVNVVWAAVEWRLNRARAQRRCALHAAGGATAPVPEGAGPLRRGRFLIRLGLLLPVPGAALIATASFWDATDDRLISLLVGWLVIGWGVTALLSGWLGRRRAAALRGAPVPVLRVLTRDDAYGTTEVFASDDVGALRPLFVVSAEEWYEDEEEDDEPLDDEPLDDEEPDELFDADEDVDEDDEAPGPLREAVLYGAAHDGAEVVIVSASEDADDPGDVIVESSTGPVRLLSERAVRLRIRADKVRVRRAAAYEERHAAAEAVTTKTLGSAGSVRRWRAGPLDWLVCVAIVIWAAAMVLTEGGSWRYVPGAFLGLIGVFVLPGRAAWRITADKDGLWLSGLRGTRHIQWDHLMVVRCAGGTLRVASRRARFGGDWSAHAPRWPWLERRYGLIHPYEKVAAEITAMWRDPELRPTETGAERVRGRALWPVGAVLCVVWVAALVLVP
ncbi:hypothetical protein [Streptomyces graminofaciens]|nr:hypothetical protein [Streptomyces graminofaciens]